VIAVVVIGGQTLSLLLTLLATPVVYSLLDDLGLAFRRRGAVVPAPGVPSTATKASAEDGGGGERIRGSGRREGIDK
jgi:HAE1 family hydrophobic/amphiphilic exporter-1